MRRWRDEMRIIVGVVYLQHLYFYRKVCNQGEKKKKKKLATHAKTIQ
jgi:hypothetical protein